MMGLDGIKIYLIYFSIIWLISVLWPVALYSCFRAFKIALLAYKKHDGRISFSFLSELRKAIVNDQEKRKTLWIISGAGLVFFATLLVAKYL